ncbi:MAG: hypothetical protein M3Y22_00955 [Pseudomonadota bacterium]|nr:hypothetical protein [Pseudomonadota bacterium]
MTALERRVIEVLHASAPDQSWTSASLARHLGRPRVDVQRAIDTLRATHRITRGAIELSASMREQPEPFPTAAPDSAVAETKTPPRPRAQSVADPRAAALFARADLVAWLGARSDADRTPFDLTLVAIVEAGLAAFDGHGG